MPNEANSNENITIFGKKFDLTRKQFITIVLLSTFFLLSSSFYSLVLKFKLSLVNL
jgi:hypothetical protein